MTPTAAYAPSAPFAEPPRYTGKERDTESGNDYMFARYYNSATGRFLSPDWSAKYEPVPYAKMEDPQSLNLYGYMQNNPLGGVDQDGHCDWCQKLGNFVTGNGWKTNAQLSDQITTNVTTTVTTNFQDMVNALQNPDFVSVNVEYGVGAGSVSYIPSSGDVVLSLGGGTGTGASITEGWATDAHGYLTGPSGGPCGFAVVGGCGGISTSGDVAAQVGVGFGGGGVSGGYGVSYYDELEEVYDSIPVTNSQSNQPAVDGLTYDPDVE